MRIEPASTLDLSLIRELFNEGFSDYLVPMQLDESVFRDHVNGNDIDLDCSQVAIDDRPAALALIARRGAAGWVAGMGTAPAYRRRGLGERALVAGLEAARRRGCQRDVARGDRRQPRGDRPVREARLRPGPGGGRVVAAGAARRGPGVATGRPGGRPGLDRSAPGEPRAVAARRRERGPDARAGIGAARTDGRPRWRGRGAVLFRDDAETRSRPSKSPRSTMDAAADALLAAAGPDRGLRLSNAPVGEAPARALDAPGRASARPSARDAARALSGPSAIRRRRGRPGAPRSSGSPASARARSR